ncbi:hypothetical protein [Agathobaculum sp.]|uniref:hypothetical protein n=1 Tax=Agathobaculum sp. TaxID=2048138 RepID=UPI003FA407A2
MRSFQTFCVKSEKISIQCSIFLKNALQKWRNSRSIAVYRVSLQPEMGCFFIALIISHVMVKVQVILFPVLYLRLQTGAGDERGTETEKFYHYPRMSEQALLRGKVLRTAGQSVKREQNAGIQRQSQGNMVCVL